MGGVGPLFRLHSTLWILLFGLLDLSDLGVCARLTDVYQKGRVILFLSMMMLGLWFLTTTMILIMMLLLIMTMKA